MKILIVVIALTFIIVTAFTMFFTGTYKRFLHSDDELNGETADANGEVVESQINEAEQSETPLQEDVQEVEEPQHQLSENTTTLKEPQLEKEERGESTLLLEKLQAQLLEYKEQIVAAEKELTAIKVEIESLKKQKTSITAGQQLAKIYGSMKSDGAASVLCELNEDLTKQILSEMNDRTAGKIMDAIAKRDPSYAVNISKLIADSDKPWFP